ncbi:MFS transporter [Gloeocapsa sp. PCC 7428]|uniref:MFS transporter n=1 Tax=Gloeocapsa sp. PCC 7428 TaxID=1173026 RepID=UPI001E5483CA|nr:MFS transporter [Gloeocapsa sp. PCC 7428]
MLKTQYLNDWVRRTFDEVNIMLQGAAIAIGREIAQFGLAQIPIVTEEILTPEEASVMFSGPQFLVALVAGVVMAFAFQLLLTNFSVAFGISSLGGGTDSDESDSGGMRKIGGAVGLWTLVTVTVALFVACFLAVKLSLVESSALGAIIGVVIWATFFSLLVWLGSTAVGSLIGSVVSTATSGLQGIMGTAATAIGANAARNQAVSTAEEITAAVRRELTSGFDPSAIQNTLQSSLANLQLPQLDVKEIGNQFQKILQDSDLQSIVDSDLLQNIDRQTFVDLVSSRTDLSKQDINAIADQLEGVWKNTVGQQGANPQAQLLKFLQNATAEQLRSSDLGNTLQQLVGSDQKSEQPQKEQSGVMGRTMQLGVEALVGALLTRTDLSDLDIEKISAQLQKVIGQTTEKATEKAKEVGTQVAEKPQAAFSAIRNDLDNYLLNSYAWHLNRETIKQEFKDVIYDPEAAPGKVRRELEQIDRDYVVQKLQQRGDLLESQINDIAEQLESIRQEVLSTVQQTESQEQSQDLRSRVENYLRSTGKEELNPEAIEQEFKTLLEDPEAGFEALSDRLSQFDRDTLVQLLKQRDDISEEEANNLVGQLESTRDSVLNRAKEAQEQAQAKADEVRQKVEDYLRNTNKEELNPDGIKRDFQKLVEDPQAGFSALRSRLSQFDRDTLVQLLSQRGDLSEEQINQTIDQIESARKSILQAPQKAADKAKEQYEQTTAKLAEYLRNTNLEELDPEGIQRDLTKLLDDPREGALALRDRLAQVDRETLVKLLSQREDLSEEQVNQAIDQVQASISNIVKAPRRLATRAQKQAQDFGASLESYLKNTNKEELNPEGIKRDLQVLLNDPRAGLGNIGDRLQQFDRETLVALLAQREDISEEEANRIVDQVESVRNQLVEQVQKVQQTVQSTIDGAFGKIRDYLNSLERPELNYEGIKADFQKVFDDPQAGFEALQNRLSQFDRETLVSVLSSREDISEADANRIIAQVEEARNSVIQRAQAVQEEVQRRLVLVKEQAQKQAEATKKAAASAAWWLFSAAATSLAASAIAGAIAVVGIRGLIG